jgi:hypothetical protein
MCTPPPLRNLLLQGSFISLEVLCSGHREAIFQENKTASLLHIMVNSLIDNKLYI